MPIPLAEKPTDRTSQAIADVLNGGARPFAALLFVGPAVIASIAYMDPGNFATNIQAGSQYGYGLLWVVALANLLAMLFQALSARLGIVTGKNLAELCRDHLPRPAVIGVWLVSELAAMATDLAEFVGAAIGLSLLLHLPIIAGMAITAVLTVLILQIAERGFRVMEATIAGFVATIAVCFLAELLIAPVDWGAVARHTVTPHLADSGALTIAVGMVGATVMPHAIFLHSGLMQRRASAPNAAARRRLIRYSDREVVVALIVAGMVNMAMVILAAAAFHEQGHREVVAIETAYHVLTPLLGGGAAAVFLLSLLASGLSSSAVGTLAGQMIMDGLLRRRLPLWLRRAVTMLPAFAVVLLGVDTTRALVLSQVVLSFALPVPMVALVIFTGRRDLMGEHTNNRLVQAVALLGAAFVIVLNAVLLVQTLS